jgi:hypothetical protein
MLNQNVKYHHSYHRHKYPTPKQNTTPKRNPNSQQPKIYIICSPEGCAIVSDPSHIPCNQTAYLTPDYKDFHSDDEEDPHSKLAI